MKIGKKKALTLFALTLLITTVLLINMNGRIGAQVHPQPIFLHGPSLTPIHLNMNKTLTPVHLHSKQGIIDLYENPISTYWHELYPNYSNDLHLTSYNDTGEPEYEFSPNDQIDMFNETSGNTTWYHVDRITYTLNLSSWPEPIERKFIEFKWPPWEDPIHAPISTDWHEVWPNYSNTYHIINWVDNFNGILDFCDTIDINMTKGPTPGVITTWHVDDVATDLILREKIMDPKSTWWHEIYPNYSNWHHLTSWESYPDEYCDRLSPGDQIDMVNETSGNTTWYHVDRVTVTINVTWNEDPTNWSKLELKTFYFEEMYEVFKHPWYSLWHEVYPNYSNVYNLTWWDPGDPWWDNCNGVLDPCDYIELQNMTAGEDSFLVAHIVDMSYDLILNKKIADPVSTDWHELYPNPSNWYHAINWSDNDDGVLSPSDQIGLYNQSDGTEADYLVEHVTLTLELYNATYDETIYIEFDGLFEEMYLPKTEPVSTWWHEVYPEFSLIYNITDWIDNCNGVLDRCDNVTLMDEGGLTSDWHVEELAIDMVVTEKVPPPPVPPMFWKGNYTEYAPSGVPDFDQRQDMWDNPPGSQTWTWCAPVAVANSLSWMDSRFDYDPTGSRLVTNYTAGIDDHDPSNVQPFISHLAYLMDTDGIRASPPVPLHVGTWVQDIESGIAQYLSWTGVNPLGDVNGDGTVDQTDWHHVNAVVNGTNPFDISADISPVTLGWPTRGVADNVVNMSDLWLVGNHTGETGLFYEETWQAPPFAEVEDWVYECEDVILVLGFYTWTGAEWYREGYPYEEGSGHCVTVAGVNSTSEPPLIAISDPIQDNAEPPPQGSNGLGRVLPPPPHPHNATPPHTLHNNASYVSQDIYNITTPIIPPIPFANFALENYSSPQYPGMPPPIAAVEWGIKISPLRIPVHDIQIQLFEVMNYECRYETRLVLRYKLKNEGTEPWSGQLVIYANMTQAYFTSPTGQLPLQPSINYSVTVGSIAPGETKEYYAIWETEGNMTTPQLIPGKYDMSAYIIPVAGETDTGDNSYDYFQTVFIISIFDVNKDVFVNIGDLSALKKTYSGVSGYPVIPP